ncbi:multipass membrane protein [Candidatus Mancarchaeum acidiphilum]|uniref:Multipass membrane protein n=1 Tax=Candidatus Mancarchaeum acidiphilum TaxID=1920749 RepID=A0A218NLQ6_9ARCH|nr:DUF373 family protein [Candidatus Mancarchaeum acidiphilum]ASI13407.1 multipass membrane protein [Candidatus Mancarchaeum acidiphilum]
MSDRLLVLAVDIDNDLFQKTGINGPVVGREKVLDAAAKLTLADPLDSDGNTLFEAVKKYDELKEKDYEVYVAEITGAVTENFLADEEISRQIDQLMNELKVDACVLVTDGASDNRVLPILKTRLKVNSVDYVRIKQAEGFENTYFTIMEKLKEPHYARIVFGIPAILILLFSISYYFHLGIAFPFVLIGLYLIIKGIGADTILIDSFTSLGMSIKRISFIFYIASILFAISSLIVGYSSYISSITSGNSVPVSYAYSIEGILLLFPISIVLYIIGRIIDLNNLHMYYRVINQGVYIGYSVITLSLVYVFSAWIIGQIYFSQLIGYAILAFIIGYAVTELTFSFKRHVVKGLKLKNKVVINELGTYIGKVYNINIRKSKMSVKTDYNLTLTFDIDRIVGISDRVIIR